MRKACTKCFKKKELSEYHYDSLGFFKDSTKIVSKAFEYLTNRGSYARTV
jgi:hypothetical protein